MVADTLKLSGMFSYLDLISENSCGGEGNEWGKKDKFVLSQRMVQHSWKISALRPRENHQWWGMM